MENLGECHIIEEGGVIPKQLYERMISCFSQGDVKVRGKEFISQFTGVIIKNDEDILISYPKNFLRKEEYETLSLTFEANHVYLKLVISAINKLMQKKDAMGKEISEDMQGSYPIAVFLDVLDYYNRYGLHFENEYSVRSSSNGKVNWKSTIKRSPKIVASNGIIFTNLYSKKIERKDTFISHCMSYVINTTLDKFGFLFRLPRIKTQYSGIDWQKKELIIQKLLMMRRIEFNDKQKKLIDSLIRFFSYFVESEGMISFKTRNFNLVWEDMVNLYLTERFIGMKRNREGVYFLQFSENKVNHLNFQKMKYSIDSGPNEFSIEPDHVGECQESLYLFDSKYYKNIKALDYKQLTYLFLMGILRGEEKKIYAALLMPTSSEKSNDLLSNRHFFFGEMDKNTGSNLEVIQQEVNVITVIKCYLGI